MPDAMATAAKLAEKLSGLLSPDPVNRVIFLGRIGHGPDATSRSLRLPIDKLIHNQTTGYKESSAEFWKIQIRSCGARHRQSSIEKRGEQV